MLKPVFNFSSIEEYISVHPANVKTLLNNLRLIIKKAAPQAEETISYQMPAYKFHGVLVHFAAFKDHLSFFPTSSGVQAFKHKLKNYNCSKGTIRFPLDKPIPEKLISEIVKFRVKENLAKKSLKKKI